MGENRIIERKLRSTKVRLFTVPCCSIILFSSEGMKKNVSEFEFRSGEPPKSRIRVGFGFRVSGFVFRVSGFGFRRLKPTFAVGFGFRVSGFGFRRLKPTFAVGFGFRVSGFGFRRLKPTFAVGFGFRVSGFDRPWGS